MSGWNLYLKLFIAAMLVVITGWMANFLNSAHQAYDADVLSAQLSKQIHDMDEASLLYGKGFGDPPADPCLLYDSGKLIRWSKAIDFPLPLVQYRDTLVHWRSPAGHFLQSWKHLTDGRMVVTVLPLIRYYQLPGGLTFERHHSIFGKQAPVISSEKAPNSQPVIINGKTIFYLERIQGVQTIPGIHAWSCLLALLLSLTWMMVLLRRQVPKYPIRSILGVAICLTGFRLFMILTGFPGSSPDIPILDPAVFASSFWSDNVLNFALNQFFLLAFCLFVHRTAARIPLIRIGKLSGWRWMSMILVLALAVVFSYHLPFTVLRTVFEDSILLPDFTRTIKFNPARITALVAIITSGASAWILVQTIIRLAMAGFLKNGTGRLIFAVVCLLSSYVLAGREFIEQSFGFALLVVMVCSRYSQMDFQKVLRLRQTGGLLVMLLISSCLALGIRSMELERQRRLMLVFARTLQAERDEFGEYFLSKLVQKIRNDAFIRMVAESPLSDKERILRKLYQYHFSGYLSRFRSEAGFYDASGVLLEGNTPADLSSLLAGTSRISGDDSSGIVLRRSRETTADGLGKAYVLLVPVGNSMVAVTVVLQPTNVGSPWFLRFVNNATESSPSIDFSYSVIEDKRFIYQSGGSEEYIIPEDVPRGTEEEWFNINGTDHLAVPMQGGRTLVVSGYGYTPGRLLTNLSFYLFTALVIMAMVMLYGLFLERLRGHSLTYANRIQIYLSVAFVLPLLLTAIAIIRNISLDRERQVTMGNRQAVLILAEEAGRLANEGNGLDGLQPLRTAMVPKDGYIIYDLDGSRLFSSQPEILETSLIPHLMNPVALNRLRKGVRFTAVREEVGGLPFQGTYAAINAGVPNHVIGWLFVPFFDHYAAAEQARIGVLMSILPIAALVFISFMIVSLRMSERLTRPILDISRALRRTGFPSGGISIKGAPKDEIGRMMEAYNQMMVNLEKSKVDLLATQREADWRDMARQVAHEIRNPLTPIRLKLQRLQQRIGSVGVEPEEASATINAVLTQTDIISGIAESFSALAGFPRLQAELFDVVAETEQAMELFRDQQEGSLILNPVLGPVMVMFDRSFFSRILSNLLLNAFQSRTGPVQVEVSIAEEVDKVTITVKDNGAGIDPAVGSQIFQPRFTTKTGGSGFGLAIARRGLEEGGGHIWFQSTPGIGSEFYFSVPKGKMVTPG